MKARTRAAAWGAMLLLALPSLAAAPAESAPVTPKVNQPAEARVLSRAFADVGEGAEAQRGAHRRGEGTRPTAP